MRFERIAWDDRILQSMEKSLNGDGDILKYQVLSGIARLWKVGGGDSLMITRGEIVAGERVFVVCCYEGKNITKAAPEIINLATSYNYGAIRYHTKHKGLVRLVANKYGFECIEKRLKEDVYYLRINKGNSYGRQ